MNQGKTTITEKIPFTDDWMFGMVLRDAEICKELLQRILPEEEFDEIQMIPPADADAEEIDEMESEESVPQMDADRMTTEIQAFLKFGKESHGVRFDAYAKSRNVWAEIEMQTFSGQHLGKRSRYYSATMDVDFFAAGGGYEDLKRSYVIFICTFDYMKTGDAVYFFQHFDAEKGLPFTDESYILILNTSCNPEKVPERLKALYAYINDPVNSFGDDLVERIDRQVEKYNGSEWRRAQMTLSGYVKDRERRARKEGHAEGLKAGEAEALRRVAVKMKASGMTNAEIAELTGLGEKEIEEL